MNAHFRSFARSSGIGVDAENLPSRFFPDSIFRADVLMPLFVPPSAGPCFRGPAGGELHPARAALGGRACAGTCRRRCGPPCSEARRRQPRRCKREQLEFGRGWTQRSCGQNGAPFLV
ncbi:unnamed protein product [Prorocentrum cordatum]|uniref:Uncharacterized protein n=1 Tax=Prorocentrum cordatum TaxID=2364126 RepID=A0ABN9RFF5_9DINO|nr:unnamed protein product [Polarella glacialis]